MLLYPGSGGSAIAAGREGVGGAGVAAGMVAVRAGGVCFPGRGGPDGTGRDSAWVVDGAGGGLVAGQTALFCQPVTAAPVVVRRDGRVQARGHVADHVRLGVLEDHLPAGVVEESGPGQDRP